MRRLLGLLVFAVMVLFAAALGQGAVGAQETPPSAVSWQSAGDSYSSGEGVFGNVGACAQSDLAFGPSAASVLENPDHGWTFASKTFTACTGHLVEDYFNERADSGGKASLWQWGREQGGPERVDVISMSFGGNDVGFADVLADCILGLPESWRKINLTGVAESLGGCDESEEELGARIDALVDPTKRDCVGTRHDGRAGFDCDLDLGDRRGSIADFYYDIVTQRLTDRGRLYIVGYPRLFADVDQWPRWSKIACQGVTRGDTQKLGRLAERLNNRLQDAVKRANQAIGTDRVIFVDRFALYRDGLHELCGSGEDWMNGIAVDRGEGLGIRKETSFHPNPAGHAGTAASLVSSVEATFPRSTPSAEGTVCGEVQNNNLGHKLEVYVVDGPAECSIGLRLADEYYNQPHLDAQGSSGAVQLGEWMCASNPGSVFVETGEAGGCGNNTISFGFRVPQAERLVLSVDGMGAVKVGMSLDALDDAGFTVTRGACLDNYAVSGLGAEFEVGALDGTIHTVGLSSESTSGLSTVSGISIGSTEQDVRQAYTDGLELVDGVGVGPTTRVYRLRSAPAVERDVSVWFWVTSGEVFRIDVSRGTEPWLPC